MAESNNRGFTGELVRFRTGDGLELHGFLVLPTGRQKPVGVLHVHGWDGNFYENRFIYDAAAEYTGRGMPFLAANNRGHDYISDILREPQCDYVQLGGMYERLGDCIEDIRAGLRLLAGRGCRRFILQGHSHGAVKVAHYLSTIQDKRVAGLVLLSPSDDLGWGRKLLGSRFEPTRRKARALVKVGRERELLPAGTFPSPVSAGTFLDCFGPDSIAGMFNLSRTDRAEFPELAAVRVPVFVAVGTVEEAFPMEPAEYVRAIGQAMTGVRSFHSRVIRGAPHNFLGREKQLAAALGRWLDEVK